MRGFQIIEPMGPMGSVDHFYGTEFMSAQEIADERRRALNDGGVTWFERELEEND